MQLPDPGAPLGWASGARFPCGAPLPSREEAGSLGGGGGLAVGRCRLAPCGGQTLRAALLEGSSLGTIAPWRLDSWPGL